MKAALLRAVSTYGVSVVLGNLVPLLTLPLITRALSVEEFGTLGSLQALYLLLGSVGTLGIGSALFRYYPAAVDGDKRRTTLNTGLLIGGGAALVLGTALIFVQQTSLGRLTVAIAVAGCFQALGLVTLRVRNRPGSYLVCQLVQQGLYLAGIVCGLSRGWLSTRYVLTVILASTVVSTVAGWGIGGVARSLLTPPVFDRATGRHLLVFSLPLLAVALSLASMNQGGVLLLRQLGTAQDTGLFTLANKLALGLTILQMSFYLAWPYFGYAHVDRTFHQEVFNLFTVGAATAMLVIAWAAPWLMAVLGGFEYRDSVPLAVGMLGAVFLGMVGGFLDTSAGIGEKTWLVAIGAAGAAAVFWILGWALIPLLGAGGVVYAAYTSQVALLLYRFVVYRRLVAFRGYTLRGVAFAVIVSAVVVVFRKMAPSNNLLLLLLLGTSWIWFRRDLVALSRAAMLRMGKRTKGG
jgi:O-antigen/teichoic acid export membrane protein